MGTERARTSYCHHFVVAKHVERCLLITYALSDSEGQESFAEYDSAGSMNRTLFRLQETKDRLFY